MRRRPASGEDVDAGPPAFLLRRSRHSPQPQQGRSATGQGQKAVQCGAQSQPQYRDLQGCGRPRSPRAWPKHRSAPVFWQRPELSSAFACWPAFPPPDALEGIGSDIVNAADLLAVRLFSQHGAPVRGPSGCPRVARRNPALPPSLPARPATGLFGPRRRRARASRGGYPDGTSKPTPACRQSRTARSHRRLPSYAATASSTRACRGMRECFPSRAHGRGAELLGRPAGRRFGGSAQSSRLWHFPN